MIDLDILTVLRERASGIRHSAGYQSDAGAHVYLGRVFDLESDPVPAIVITQPEDDADLVEDDETPTVLRIASTYVVEAYAQVDADDPLPDLMRLRADLIRAIYRPGADLPDTLGGLINALRLVSSSKLMPAPGSRLGMAQLTLTAEYHQHTGDAE